MTDQTAAFTPPAAEGLPPGALDSATGGASALDAWAREPVGRNFLAHALVGLARDGWLRAEPGEGFETVQDWETPEPLAADRVAPPSSFALWLDASDGSVPTHDGFVWPDGTATVHHRHFGHTTTHADPEAARQSAHGKQGRIVWPETAPADRAAGGTSGCLESSAASSRQPAFALNSAGRAAVLLGAAGPAEHPRLNITPLPAEALAADEVFVDPAAFRTAVLREEADRIDSMPEAQAPPLQKGITWTTSELRRMADETQQPEAQAPVAPEAPAVCEGFQWIGQSFAICDRCGQPAWEHAGEDVPVEGAGPFDNRRTVRPWAPGQADRIRAKWGTPAAVQQPKEARP